MIPTGSLVAGVSVLSGLAGPLARLASQEGTGAAVAAPSTSLGASPASTPDAALREVLSRYDVTHITPRQYTQMLDELRQTGALTSSDLNQLSEVLGDLDQQSIDPDEEVNLVQFYTDQLDKLQDRLEADGGDEAAFSGVATSLASVQNRLTWVTKFSLLHAAPSVTGIDTLT